MVDKDIETVENKQILGINPGVFYGLAAALIWSGFILVSRQGGVSPLNSFDVITIRYLTCSLLLLPIWWFKFRFNVFQPRFIIISVIGGLAYALFTFQGFQIASASHAAILLPGLIPLFLILLATFVDKGKVPLNKWLGLALISLSIAALIWPLLKTGHGINNGHLFLAAGAFCWALFSILIKRWEITPWQVTVCLAFLTCCLYLPIYVLFLPKNIALDIWQDIALQAFYQGFMATIVQMIFYVKAVRSIGAGAMGSIMAIVPIISGLGAVYIFSEPLTSALVIGLIGVSTGAIIVHTKIPFLLSKKASK
ncbi:DMT family transporter [Marinomonas sp.]|nr:DMT family transporter [Marinomonas sp.]MDB4837456.1 DMT family transporter [Marinomonas sp.]